MIEFKEPGEVERFDFGAASGLGSHYLADFHNCAAMPQRAIDLERLMLDAAEKIGATIVASSFHEFSPHGLSGVVVIAESHLAAHTWPENGVACIDLFTCSSEMDPRQGLKLLFEGFAATTMTLSHAVRGQTGSHEADRSK